MKEISTKKLLETIIEGIRNRKGQRIVTIDLRKIKSMAKNEGFGFTEWTLSNGIKAGCVP